MIYDVTQRVKEAWEYYDKLLERNIQKIAELSGVDQTQLIKLNPAEFIEKNRFQKIEGYKFKNIKDWITENKTNETFLISPEDTIEETAEQIGYKSENTVTRKIRASKCEVVPVPKDLALDFCIRNHRQSLPNISNRSVYLGLLFNNELVAIMGYDTVNGAVRGDKGGDYELVRLAIAKHTQIYGGASKLQKACEQVLKQMGIKEIFSYSNATINSGSVYEKLGFICKKVEGGQPFVIMRDNRIVRLVSLHPHSTDEELALRQRLKTHIGGNKLWVKELKQEETQEDE